MTNSSCVILSESYKISMALEQAHAWMLRNFIYKWFLSKLNVSPHPYVWGICRNLLGLNLRTQESDYTIIFSQKLGSEKIFPLLSLRTWISSLMVLLYCCWVGTCHYTHFSKWASDSIEGRTLQIMSTHCDKWVNSIPALGDGCYSPAFGEYCVTSCISYANI